jgi:hypothetical protein
MSNVAEVCGGIGVAIMVFKTDLEKALADQGAALGKTAGPLAKMAGMIDRLQKSMALGQTLRKARPTLADLEAEHAYLLKRRALMDEIESLAVAKFAVILKRYGINTVYGDAYAGQTFRADFSECGIDYQICRGRVGSKLREADTAELPAVHRTDLYEALEPALNAGEIELLDLPKLKEQLLTLVVRGSAIDHEVGGFDDWANAAAGALYLVNPNRAGNYAEHWLRYYQNLPEREAAKEAAASASQPPNPPSLQFGYSITPRPAVHVPVKVPGEISSIIGMSGTTYTPTIVDGVRVAHLGAEDAKALILGSSAFREENPDLLAQLGRVEPPRPRIRISDVLQTAADAAARNPLASGSMVTR